MSNLNQQSLTFQPNTEYTIMSADEVRQISNNPPESFESVVQNSRSQSQYAPPSPQQPYTSATYQPGQPMPQPAQNTGDYIQQPTQTAGYQPPMQQGYPPQNSGDYIPQQVGYPQQTPQPMQQGYPPQPMQQGYPPQSQQSYPSYMVDDDDGFNLVDLGADQTRTQF